MNTSGRILGIALAVLMLAARGWADEAEDRAERYLKKRGIEVFRETDDPVRRPFTHVNTVRIYFPDFIRSKVTDEVMNQLAAFKHLKHLLIQGPGYPNYRSKDTLTDERLKPIAELKELVTLELWGQFTDDGLKHLAGLKKLRELALSGHRIKGTGLKHVSALNQLRALKLRDTAIDDEALKGIGALKNLEKLDLADTKISSDGLKHLAGLQKLRELDLGFNNHITDKAMKHVAALTALRDLWLYGTKVTDAGLAESAPLQKLEGLNLVSVKGVTDKGLRNLRTLKNLRGVNAGGTRATDKGAAELQKAHPQLGVRLHDEDEDDRRGSSRTPSQGDNVAQVLVIVPEDAEVWFDGEKTKQTGSHRTFWSPVLTPGKTYSYQVKARWLENGNPVVQTQTIEVSANRISRVDFTKPKREPLAPHRGIGGLRDAAFSPDGKLLATATALGENRIILWDPATLRRLGEFKGRGPLAFSPDGKLLAGSRQDDSVRIWDVSSRKEVRRLPAPSMASCLAFAPGGRELAVLDAFSGRLHNRLVLWDVKTGRSIFESEEVPPGSGTVVFSPDGRSLAVGGGQPRERRDDEPDPKPRPRDIQPSIVILDAASGRLRRQVQGEYSTYQLRYTPEGKTLIASGGPQPITMWDPHTGRLLGKFGRFQGGAHGLTLTSDGRTLVYEEGGNWVCVRRLDGELVRRWHVPVRVSRLILALSPDDRTLLTGGLQDPGFRLWDITTGKELFPTERPPAKRP